ncbi:MAG: hypothetical protein WAU39_17590 [Polyangiales bacterium]
MLTPVESVKRGDRLMHPHSGWMAVNYAPEPVLGRDAWELEVIDDRSEIRELWFFEGDLIEVEERHDG